MWWDKSKDAALEAQQAQRERGLTEQEVQRRLAEHGPNKLAGQAKKSWIARFFAQLKDMLIYVLIGAAVITLLIGEFADAIIILLVVLLNAIIGLVQERKAEQSLEALQKMTTLRAIVRRDGQVQEISSEALVPGDIVLLDAGRTVPADLRLLEGANLQIDESALTGESVPVDKDADLVLDAADAPIGDRANMAYMSTIVTYGRGEGVVVAVGMETEIGRIAQRLDQEEESMTPLQLRLEELGKTLGYIAIGICVLIFVIGWFQERDLFEIFLTAISLAVAAIPEGLPAIVAIVLAIGVTAMARNNAIVKKLPAVETLGSVNIICSDKTGTLTQNKMTVVKHYTSASGLREAAGDAAAEAPAAGSDVELLVQAMVLCSDAAYEDGKAIGDPTEVALIELGRQYGMMRNELHSAYPRTAEAPFDSDRKMMSVLNRTTSGYRVHTKGAIDQLLQVSDRVLVGGETVPLTEELKRQFSEQAEAMSDDALRVLAAAYKDTPNPLPPEEMEKDLTLIGLVGMIDPPRLEVKDSIREAKQAGITPVMITGDHRNTAFAIAQELGIAEKIEQSVAGTELDKWSDEELARQIRGLRVFARVSPEHKVRLVKAFKSQGHIVSMTGDGVNDAPSLKAADIGVAMGITGTDVAKGASDMILTDDNFTTIVHAIRQGRNIYRNIKKAVVFLLACNLGEVVAILASILFFWPLPLLPTQILWINLMTDTLPAIALGMDPGEKDVMKQRPRNPKESFFAHGAGVRAILGGLLIGLLTLIAFYRGLSEHGYGLHAANIPDDVMTYARTMAFVVLAASQMFYSLAMRHELKSILQIGLFTNKKLIGAIVLGLALQFIAISVPFLANAFQVQFLSLVDWGIVLGLSLIPLIVNEIVKIFLRMADRSETRAAASR